jgi:phosphoglycolate phosphatase
MSPKKIIVFDLDGTLVDSSDNITRAINFVRNDSNLPPLDKDTITSNINRDDINPAKIFYEVDVFTARQRELFETFYMDVCAEDLAHYEHIPQILEKLKSLGFSLSVATNGASHFANKMLSSLKLADFFDHLVGANNVSSPKPSPDMLHLILNEYGYSEIDFTPFLVGDSIKDIKAASSAGIKSAFATWGFGDDVDLADEKLQSAKEIERLLGHFGV